MFGSVSDHLPEGVLRDEDLKVLLSERAAQQIWQKWIDTLEAKKIELQLHQNAVISRAQSTPVGQPGTDSRPPERSSTEPEQLTNIMSEQSAQHTSTREVYKVVVAVCNENMARKMKLRQLYGRFRSLDRDTINYILLKNSFNFSAAAEELKRELARDKSDGNTASQSGLPSFAGTAARSGGTSGKVGRPVRQTARPRPAARRKRAKNAAANQLRRNEDAQKWFQDLEDAPSYDDLRAEAALHAKLRSEAFQKAAGARSQKQGEVALYYAQIGHSHTERMKEANRRAADLILQLQNDVSSQYLDLHGLHVEEAIAALQERLLSASDEVLYVITGKGIHSKGEARIKPAVMHYLRSKGYMFEEQTGRLIVRLT
jgi:NEDD4-binding protein 2